MAITFNTILRANDIPPSEVRLLRHQDNRAMKGRSPYELWRDKRPDFDAYQGTMAVGNASKLKADYWASFVGTPTGETLFVGLYRVNGRRDMEQDSPKVQMDGINKAGSWHVYDLELKSALSDLIGRLIIDWGDGYRAWVQCAENQDKRVLELRREFTEPEFPGFLRFVKPLSALHELPQSWRTALQSSRGVYLLTCPRTKEQYVGSAVGEAGFWGRWQDYVDGGDGDNVGLKSRDPSDYQVCILEVAGTSAGENEILNMEGLWQHKLQSRAMGLNRNSAGRV